LTTNLYLIISSFSLNKPLYYQAQGINHLIGNHS